jgi:hypothetical protein
MQYDSDGLPHDDLMEWAVDAQTHGIYCLRALVLSIERGDAKLPIEPQAWENTMAALEWMLLQHIEGPLYQMRPITQEDVEIVRRIHALGTVAIAGGERAPELGPLADRYLSSMISGWRTASPAFPVCYPLPEQYGDAPVPERSTSSSS